MEPSNNFVNTMGPATPEKAGASVAIESVPNTLPTPEVPLSSPEQLTVNHTGGSPIPITPVLPTTQQQVVQQQPSVAVNTSQVAAPTSAADGNLIEKEWLDKVKQIISSTADDPHAQQKEISLLMADYVLKRTGRKIGEDGGQ